MLPDWSLFLLLVLLGGWTGVDTTSLGQFMVSRPVVAATLAGWMVGDVATGALLGLILEALNLLVLPVGAARYPESGPAAVAAAAVLALGIAGPSAIVPAVVFAMTWAWVSGATVKYLRHLNMRLVAGQAEISRSTASLERRHVLAIGLDFVRGAALTALGMPLLALMLALVNDHGAFNQTVSQVALWSLVAASIAATLRLFGERRTVLFGLGALGGLLLLVFT